MTQRKLVTLVLAGLLVTALLVPALGQACVKAPTKPRSVKVGRLTDLSGPYAVLMAPVEAGLADYVEYYNKKSGGIDGIPVELSVRDVKEDASLSVDAYRAFKEAGSIVISAASFEQTSAIRKLAEQDRMPVVTHSANLSLYMPPSDYIWGAGTSNAGETVAALQWFDTRVWDRARTGNIWKVGFLAQDTVYTKAGLPGMYKYCDENGIEMVGTEIIAATQLDFTVNIKRLADAGANVIFISQYGANASIALKQMQELGMLAPLETVVRTPGKAVPVLGDCAFYISSMVAVPEGAGYVYGVTPWAAWFEEDRFPGIKERNDFMRQKYGDVWHSALQDGDAYNSGWNSSRVIIAAIERAVKAVGWDKLNGQAIMEKGLKGLKLPADMSGDPSYADYDGDRIAIESVRGARWNIEKGAREPSGDFFRVDMKYYVSKYTPKKPHPGMFVE